MLTLTSVVERSNDSELSVASVFVVMATAASAASVSDREYFAVDCGEPLSTPVVVSEASSTVDERVCDAGTKQTRSCDLLNLSDYTEIK